LRHYLVPLAALAAAATVVLSPTAARAAEVVTGIGYIGQALLPTGTQALGTEVGGLSGITYDAATGRYLALSDDRGSNGTTPRYYTFNIDLSDGALSNGDITFTAVNTLTKPGGASFANNELDPEGIALAPGGTSVWLSSEGDKAIAGGPIQPLIARFDRATGQQQQTITLPARYTITPSADTTSGPRNNLVFESLAFTPNGTLVTALENALYQDGPAATTSLTSLSRIALFNPTTGVAGPEFAYQNDPVSLTADPNNAFNLNGLVDLLPLSDTEFLALERSFQTQNVGSTDTGYRVKLYQFSLTGATDVSGIDSLAGAGGVVPVSKSLVFDLSTLGVPLDNLEGITFGPTLPDGSRSLVVVADNNFAASQTTQFLAFRVTTASVPEPGTAALAGAGLTAALLIGGTRRRRRA
jgi:hypothetical protein